MPKYLFEASYTPEGAKGLLKEGGTKRLRAVEKAFKGIGGKIEAAYFGFGKNDVYIIADYPSNINVAAASLAVNSTGLATVRTTVLLTAKEIDAATKKSVKYRGPGR
ncbi:MAG: GYD domain-containing protein [Acidobacteria bacterium]|nr:GYD domain-containing protein [Acidobacteriota bacterium]